MKTATQHQQRLFALLLFAGTVGLVLLMHFISEPQQTCSDHKTMGILKLI